MKNIKKLFIIILISILTTIGLTSCSTSNDSSDALFYKGSYSNGSYFTQYKESNSDEAKDVYEIILLVSNSGNNIKINASDITIKVGNSTYTCEYFVTGKKTTSSTINGTTKTITYIESKSTSYTVKSDESRMEAIYCGFLTNPTSSFNLYYKGILLGLLS